MPFDALKSALQESCAEAPLTVELGPELACERLAGLDTEATKNLLQSLKGHFRFGTPPLFLPWTRMPGVPSIAFVSDICADKQKILQGGIRDFEGSLGIHGPAIFGIGPRLPPSPGSPLRESVFRKFSR